MPINSLHHYLSSFWQIIIVWVILFWLLRINKTGKVLCVINTMIHETGHAVFSLLTSGSVERIDLFADTSGACITGSKYWLGKFIVSLAGYPFASAAAWFGFYLLYQGKAEWNLYLLGGIACTNMVLWVRNKYGFFWLLVFICTLGGIYYANNSTLTFYSLFMINSVLLIESLWSALIILYISAENPHEAGDAKNLRD